MSSIKQRIRKVYNNIAKKYGGYRRKPWPILKKFLDSVDDDLLDIGSGNCAITKKVLEKGVKLYAVDFSLEALKQAPKEIIKIEADATRIPLKRKFKYISAIGLLHHLPTEEDRLEFLKEVKRLLSKKGAALLTSWAREDRGHIKVSWGEFERDYFILSKEELSALLRRVGFKFSIIKRKFGEKENYFIKIRKS